LTGNIRFLAKNGQLQSANTTEEKAQENGLTKRFHADEGLPMNIDRIHADSQMSINKPRNISLNKRLFVSHNG